MLETWTPADYRAQSDGLHKRDDAKIDKDGFFTGRCMACGQGYPCPTRRELDAEKGASRG